MDILTAYGELGSYRAAAALCGTTHKTVRRLVERRDAPPAAERPPRVRATDPFAALIADKVEATRGRISAKRLLPVLRAEGYTASARTLRRALHDAKAARRKGRREYRPWVPLIGEHLAIDWGEEGGLKVFCAVLAWSRWRFVRLAAREDQATTLHLLAECFEALGGVPAVVLSDRMGCLRGGVVANVVIPTSGYLAFAHHYGFRPDFCEAADPESKGVVEHLVGYAQRDLVVGCGPFADLASANAAAATWCGEVNGRVHAETSAVPAERLATERAHLRALPTLRPAIGRVEQRTVDHLRTVRFGSARYSVPGALIGRRVTVIVDAGQLVIRHAGAEVVRHELVGPGGMSIRDEHYDRPARRPARAVRPRTASERAFLALGPLAEAYLRAAAAAGVTKLPTELGLIADLERAHGRPALLAALERALAFRRFRASDVRSILAQGGATPTIARPGGPLGVVGLPAVPVREIADYAVEPVR